MIELRLDSGNGIPIYLQIVRQITYGIRAGLILPGEQLPSVRELSKKLQVNPLTIAKAYLGLEHDGLVSTRWGKGTFVAGELPQINKEESFKRLQELADRFIDEATPLVKHPMELVKLIRERLQHRT